MVVEPLPERGLILISGPSRGGKSGWAEHLAAGWPGSVAYLATGQAAAADPAWAERVRLHQERRPGSWQVEEVGAALVERLEERARAEACEPPPLLLIDSLGTWIAWHLEEDAERWHRRCRQLQAALAAQPGPVLLVVEETGWGVVPPTAIGGLFRDRLGALQQELMASCHTAWLVVAGRALNLTALGVPVPAV